MNDCNTKESFMVLLKNGFTITGHLEIGKEHEYSSEKVYFVPNSYKPKEIKTNK